jgi:multidrug efflux system membrane fusion protein
LATKQRRRRLIFILLAVAAIALAAWAILHKKPKKPPPPPPTPVTAVKAVSQDFQQTLTAIGAAQAWTSDMIYAQVSGKLIKVDFTEGAEVKAGQVLAEVDPRPYQAALDEAEGTLKRDEASLAGARRDLERYQHLQSEGGVARQVLEDEQSTVEQDEGTVQIDKGAVQAAQLNLEFCRIVSPVSGRAGVRLVDPGNLVSASGSVSSIVNTSSSTSSASSAGGSSSNASASAGPTSSSGSSGGSGIVVINQIQPIAVTFSVTQQEFLSLQATSNGFTKPLQVQALNQDTGQVLDSGQLSVADNRVDQATGTVELKARFTNNAHHLWPGEFVNVLLGAQTLPKSTLIPLAAVNRGPKGQYVFVVGPDGKVAIRQVALVTTQGQVAVVKSGVNPGDTIVIDGQMVLDNGQAVRVAKWSSLGNATP